MRIWIKILFIVLLTGLFAQVASGGIKGDELGTLLKKVGKLSADTNKVKVLNKISFGYYSIDPDSGIKFAWRALELSKELGWDNGVAEAQQNLGINNSVKGDYDKAKHHFNKSLAIYRGLDDKDKVSRLLGNLGAVSMSQSDFTAALDYYQQALGIDSTGANAARQLGNIGLVYTNLKDYNKALEYNIRSLKISEELSDKERISKQLSNIGLNYSYLKDYGKALEYYERALAIDEQLNNAKGQAIRLGNIGVLHWNLYEYKEALEYYERALQKNEEVGSKSGVAVNLNNLGELYFRLSQDTVIDRLRGSGLELSKAYNLSRAGEYARKAENISLSIGNKRQLIEIYGLLDRLNASRGDYKSAYQYQTEWARLKDSIFSVEKTSEIANLEARKENEIREKELKLKDLELRRKRNEQYVLIAGIVVIIVVMFVILRQRRKSEKLLLNILPVKIAKRLKKNEKNIADRFDEVSIIFIDIVEFTSYSKETAPEEVVSALNDIFTKFDMLLIKHGLEKIKTIGDCYMAVAGLPEPMKEHAVATAKFALEVKDVMHNYVTPDGRKLQFRIGVDSGPVVAGVIGESKFSYDLWGDAVNMASRMESSGLSNEIQVTENFVNEVKDFGIRYVERGQTEIKGKGTVTTYLLR